jgi:hypothetical protein
MVQRLAKLLKQVSTARVEIAQLRAEGVKLRNEGCAIGTDEGWQTWKKAVEDWEKKVITARKQISEAHPIWFGTLDVVVPARIKVEKYGLGHPGDHEKLFREHDLRSAAWGR